MIRFEKKRLWWVMFRELEEVDGVFTERSGRVGKGEVKSTRTPFAIRADAQSALSGRADELRQAGWTEMSVEPDPLARPSEPKVELLMNPELEAAIIEDPDDPEAYLVYADWLQQQQDPRGELIMVQHGLLGAPEDQALVLREAELLSAHKESLLGPAYPLRRGLELRWHLGYVREMRVGYDWETYEELAESSSVAFFGAFLASPVCRLLQNLTVGILHFEGENTYQAVADLLAELGGRLPLRSLFLGDFEQEECEVSWSEMGNVERLWPAFPQLEKVILQSGSMELGEIVLPEARHFEIRTGGLTQENIQSVCRAKWPKLETLILWFGDEGYGASGAIEDIAPILAGEGLGALKHLGLMNAEFSDAIAQAIVHAPILQQLETLDLSMGTLSEAGAQALIDAAPTHLKALDVSQNFLGEETQQALSVFGEALHFGRQDETYGEGQRYVSVGE